LKEMTDPIVKLEVEVKKEAKPVVKKENYARPDNFKLNPKTFDWFLEGIDKSKLDALQARLEQTMLREAP
jgi:hypothetical protein